MVAETQTQVSGRTLGDAHSRAVRQDASALMPQVGSGQGIGVLPPVLAKGKEASVTDVGGNGYVDFTAAGGALILGYADERVAVAMNKAVSKGCNVGSPTEPEVRLAELVIDRVPGIEMVRFVNARTEAAMEALALARKWTGRQCVLAFQDDECLGADRILLEHNIIDAVRESFHEHGQSIAAAIVQPVAGQFGPVGPANGFLEALRSCCDQYGAALIFDESTTGFRVDSGGAATLYGVHPDVTILGSILGGGLPLAACGGRREIMQHEDEVDRRTSSSSTSVSLPALAAGVATLETLGEPGMYDALERQSARLDKGLRSAAADAGVKTDHIRVGSMVGIYFKGDDKAPDAPCDRYDTGRFAHCYEQMLARGVHLPASPSSCWYVSTAHTDLDIDRAVEAARDAFHGSN